MKTTKIKTQDTARKPVLIDAFAGAGGLSLGLTEAGFDARAAFDYDRASVKTYRHNLGPHATVADAREVSGADLLGLAGMSPDDRPDLLAGGPPCQGFSTQNRGAHLEDERNALVFEFVRLVSNLRPRAFLMENVSPLGRSRGRHLIVEIQNLLADYVTTPAFYLTADYGIAQKRERFVLVGIRSDEPGSFAVPQPTTPYPNHPTVGDTIGDLPEPPEDLTDHSDYPNHRASNVSTKNVERFSHVPQGGGWANIPYELRLRCHQAFDSSKGGWSDVYGRLRADGQAPTITGGFDSFTKGRFGHPTSDRPITPREAARLQGFPDSFVFLGTRQQIKQQIGNAVPPPLATVIGKAIASALAGEKAVYPDCGFAGSLFDDLP